MDSTRTHQRWHSAVIILAWTFGAFAPYSCTTKSARPVPEGLDTYSGLAASIDRGDGIVIYDVRTPEEYAGGHLPGAVNVPVAEIDRLVPRSMRSEVIVVYCQSGGRSSRAYDSLVGRGFSAVFDFGAIGKWEGELEGVSGSDG